MNQVVTDAINEQINAELNSSYAYLAMSGFCELKNFCGSANYLESA